MHEDLDHPKPGAEDQSEPCPCNCAETKQADQADEEVTVDKLSMTVYNALWLDING